MGYLFSQANCQVKVVTWDAADGKGVDDLLINRGEDYFQQVYQKATSWEIWKAASLNSLTLPPHLELNSRYLPDIAIPTSAQLMAIKSAENQEDMGIDPVDIGGGAVICPNLDSNRSLSYLVRDPWGKHLEKAIARELRKLAKRIHQAHPDHIDPEAITRATTIAGFDRELVIKNLGFETVFDYYAASSPLPFQPYLTKPTFILYAADDPLFSPAVIPDLQAAIADNPHVDLLLTNHGGHVGYIRAINLCVLCVFVVCSTRWCPSTAPCRGR